MELRQLKTFVSVAQLLSFNRAAQALNYAQSTISTQIRLLEEEFGKPLFDRLGKSIVLTRAGEVLLRYAAKMLAEEKVVPGAILTLNSVEAIKHFVNQGIGVTLIPEMAISMELAAGNLVRLPWVDKELETAILMIRHKDKWVPPALQLFMDLVKDSFAD